MDQGTITEAKDYVIYDEDDEMWRYDESKSGNPALDAMDFVIDLSTTDLKVFDTTIAMKFMKMKQTTMIQRKLG